MKIHTSDKLIAYLTLLSGLTISAVAVYYSVAGLVSIFAAAAIPIIVMGSALEISKLVATVWLKLNWKRAPVFIRSYLLAAIAVLMVITSMGIFGFLSKAHSDQSLVSGDVLSKIAIYDEKIKTAKDNIDANRKALKQMDDAVDQTMVRSTTEGGADKAVQIRRSQQKERARLAQDIEAEQKKINQLMDERAPIAAEVRAVEAEVGPIKYIAAFVYGDNPDANVLEKAVTWVIIIIVSVFDPLAVILLLASQYSFQWFRQEEEDKEDSPQDIDSGPDPAPPLDDNDTTVPITVTSPDEPNLDPLSPIAKSTINNIVGTTTISQPVDMDVQIHELPKIEQLIDDDSEILESAEVDEKEAMRKWKEEHPNDSLKHQRKLLDLGIIKSLPWEEDADRDAAIEAARWAQEQLERPGDYLPKDPTVWMENVDGNQIKRYQQNAEQNDSTLWQRIQDAKK